MNYYEHHIGDYAQATAHLSFVEDSAYSRLIRKYYAEEKCLPVDVKAVQRLAGARTKEEREAVVTVLNEFFTLEEDGWHNRRCDIEVSRYQEKQDKAKRSAEARWSKPQTQSERNADAMRTHSEGNAHQTPDTSLHTKAKTKEQGVSQAATRLPADWSPNDIEVQFCKTERQDLQVETVAARFRDYWISQPGLKGRKTDWTATWRNWVRNEKGAQQARASPQPSRHGGFDKIDYNEGIENGRLI